MRCIISPRAIRDLDEISSYFAERNVESGGRLLRSFNDICINLRQFPNMGKSYSNLSPGLRGIPMNGYIIFYRVTEEELTILRVRSGKQNLESLFEEED